MIIMMIILILLMGGKCVISDTIFLTTMFRCKVEGHRLSIPSYIIDKNGVEMIDALPLLLKGVYND